MSKQSFGIAEPAAAELAVPQSDADGPASRERELDGSVDFDHLPLEAWKLSKAWQRGRVVALDDVELTLTEGSLTWIGGANGAGKTTLLRILSGLIGPDCGYVRAFGLDPFHDRRRYQQVVSFLSASNTGIYARLTVRQQLDMWARIAFIARAERPQRVQAALEFFQLVHLAERRSDRMSMGQRQRLRIAMTFVTEPRLVLLDEPRNSLDGEGRELLAAAIQGTLDRRGAVLWVSPTGESLGLACDRQMVLEDGKLRDVAEASDPDGTPLPAEGSA